ncbi:DUF1501 domain-containing protein [Agaribacterium haliotis]|uniref:DUF1501 domain-containing protein n=1 Tax=Agaribacterium haliotis TaxID=2013869 RepID=UPI000BB582F0|nr:DUF1501 domain-containing protein [Agaribacterium haliotis]
MKRRNFLRNSFYGALSTSLRASVVGVPTSFLLSGRVHAATGNEKVTILSQSKQGESINVNGPGAFASAANNLAAAIEHPMAAQLGADVLGSVNGVDHNAADLETAVDLQLGAQQVKASRPWASLPQALRENLACLWLRTGANAHPEMASVRRLKEALRDDENSSRSEELASAICLENASAMGTALNTPLLLDDEGFSKGNPIAVYRPTNLQSLFGDGASSGISVENFAALYSQTMDELYKGLKQNGSAKQRAFLDNHALTRTQARDLGDSLGDALSLIDGNDFVNQLRTAIAFAKIKLSPVIVVKHDFGRDNHSDTELRDEAVESLASLDALTKYWAMLNEQGMVDQVNLITLDCFGRTPLRNDSGGRDHYGKMTLGLMHGSGFKGGLYGDLQLDQKDELAATGINSANGSAENADIDAESTLAAYGKTIMKAAGIADDRLDIRVPSGKVISAVFTS